MPRNLKLAAYYSMKGMDQLFSKALLAIHERRGSLINLFFHMLFKDETEMHSGSVHPQEGITVAQFREIILYYLNHGYEIVSPLQILTGLSPDKNYLHLSFDDGYFTNSRALPVLEELGGTVSVFVSTDHSRLNRCIWSDSFYRVARKRGWKKSQIDAYCSKLNILKTSEIEKILQAEFPDITFSPVGDLDRMFTPGELKTFSKTGRFFFENHTKYHAVLHDYSDEEMFGEIAGAQEFLASVTGHTPVSIAYPNGVVTTRAVTAAQRAGLKMGFGCHPRKEYISDLQRNMMDLGRFAPYGSSALRSQLDYFRSDLMLTQRLRDLRRRRAK